MIPLPEKPRSKTRKSWLRLNLDLKLPKKLQWPEAIYPEKLAFHSGVPAMFTTALLHGSFTCLVVLVTGVDEKEKVVLSRAACVCEAVRFSTAFLLLLDQPEA